jgi:outer membrane receptor protein involved in Fe transport
LGARPPTPAVVRLGVVAGQSQATVEEIVVTATKRGTSLQDTPISVSVIQMEDIETLAISDILDLQSSVPSLQINQTQFAAQNTFLIRGFGNGANNPGVEPSVAISIDGVMISRNQSAINDLISVERVEVIKGPQSTLFGKNAIAGGVIQIFTKKGKVGGSAKWDFQANHGSTVLPEFGTSGRPYFGLGPFVKDGTTKNYSLSTTGGGSDLRYFLSANWSDNTGVLPDAWDDRVSIRGNFGFSPSKNLTINYNTMVSKSRNQNPPQGNN